MIKIFLYLLLIITFFQISACGQETDPKKAFDNGDYETAFSLWTPLAESGDADAQNYLGILYYLGLGVSKDYKKTLKWYELAAKAGHADAQRNYGDMINFGRGIQKDNYQAFKWYFAASQQGNEGARRQLKMITSSRTSKCTQKLKQMNLFWMKQNVL